MARRPRQSRTRQAELASGMATDFDATILHNTVHDAVAEDEQLAQVLDAAATTDHACESRADALDSDDEFVEDLRDAWGVLSHVAETRAREAVAEACATVIRDGDQWAAEDYASEDGIETAQQDAREWLRENTAVSGRLDLLEEVTA